MVIAGRLMLMVCVLATHQHLGMIMMVGLRRGCNRRDKWFAQHHASHCEPLKWDRQQHKPDQDGVENRTHEKKDTPYGKKLRAVTLLVHVMAIEQRRRIRRRQGSAK